jgi:hypothetical protein
MRRTTPPTRLDDARVIAVTDSEMDFGVAGTLEGSAVPIVALAIAEYDGGRGTYLFACDQTWNVRGDLLYDSVDEAKRDAERYYQTGPLSWTEISPTSRQGHGTRTA